MITIPASSPNVRNARNPLTFEDFPEYEGKLIDRLSKIPDKYSK